MISSSLNFRCEDTEEDESFFDLALKYYEDRNHLRGFNDLLNETKILSATIEGKYSKYFKVFSDDILCGLAWAYIDIDVIKIPIFVVDSSFREIGIGDYLFNTILNDAFFKDALTFESQVLPGDRQGKNFFEQHAGKTRKLIVQGIIEAGKTEQ